MSADARLRSVVDFLAGVGWNPRPLPLRVGELAFTEFGAVLEGPGKEHQLVIVLLLRPTTAEGDPTRPIRALVRGLERVASSRPVTVIAVGLGDAEIPRARLARLCRTVVVPADADIDTALRSLVPLELPEPVAPVGPVDVALAEALGERADTATGRALLEAGLESKAAVESALNRLLDEALAPLGLDPEPAVEEEP